MISSTVPLEPSVNVRGSMETVSNQYCITPSVGGLRPHILASMPF